MTDMQADVLFGGIKQVSHLGLRQPSRAIGGAEVDIRATVLGAIEDQFAVVGVHVITFCVRRYDGSKVLQRTV